MPPKSDRRGNSPATLATASPAPTFASPTTAASPLSSLPPGPRSACNDQFGILGLQSVVQHATPGGAASDLTPGQQNMLLLTRGFDLGNLGLMLVSTDSLHTTFAAPWLDAPSKLQPDFKLASCYAVNSPHLHYSMFQKFQDETLFYIFYSMPRDVLQLAASQELYARDWRFHKQLCVWLTRFPKTEPTIKHQAYEKGSYLVFNPVTWAKERRDDFFLQYDLLEEKSRPPASQQQQQQQQAGASAPQAQASQAVVPGN